jgi:general secretion pathway protein N
MSGFEKYTGMVAVAATVFTGAMLTLLFETPEAWIRGSAYALSGNHLQLLDIEGGVLYGSADVSWGEDPALGTPLGRWGWRYTPQWDGVLIETVRALSGPATGQTGLQLSWDGLTLLSADFTIQARAISWRNPLWTMVQPTAELYLQTEKLNIQNAGMVGEGSLTCSHAYSPQVRLPDLGSWQMHWQAEGETTYLKMMTLKGPLHLEGEGVLTAAGQPTLKLSGRLWSEARYARDLEPIIKQVGAQQPDGSVPWRLNLLL